VREPILDPGFWRGRLASAMARRGERYRAVYETSRGDWRNIEARHRQILATHVKPADSVLDCGCGWGRLLDMMPANWRGSYFGVDLTPDFIDIARQLHDPTLFAVMDLRDLSHLAGRFDWAVLISIRRMVVKNLGASEWAKMEAEIRRVADRLLFLEYAEDDEGSIE
jgi:cyclopropane fatty-acyl-phospholipid synthase-like methyltransferase